jgi:hypothetical protein
MIGFIFMMIIFVAVIFVCLAILIQGADEQVITGAIIFIAIGFLWLTIEFKTVTYGKRIPIPHTELSVMSDDEMAIIRHEDNTYEYRKVKHYNAIKNGEFEMMEIKEYNIQGEYNGSTYAVKL